MQLRVLSGAVLAGLAAIHVAPANAADLKVLASWNKSNWPTYAVLDQYVKNVEKVGAGAVKLNISGPEVVPPFEQLQPVKTGVFDLLFTHGVYHVGSKGLAATLDAVKADPAGLRKSGGWKHVDDFYQKTHGLKVLALVPSSNQGYHIFLKEPLSANGDLKGRKIRGTQTYHGVIRLLGAEPVVLPGSQIYSALEKGVVDGAAWPAAGMLTMKHFEVAKYKIRPTFGTSWLPILANLNSWKKLSDKEKQVLLDAGQKTENEMGAVGDKILADESAQLEKLGVKVSPLPADKVEAVRKTFAESLWDLGNKCCGDSSAQLRALAKKANLTF